MDESMGETMFAWTIIMATLYICLQSGTKSRGSPPSSSRRGAKDDAEDDARFKIAEHGKLRAGYYGKDWTFSSTRLAVHDCFTPLTWDWDHIKPKHWAEMKAKHEPKLDSRHPAFY